MFNLKNINFLSYKFYLSFRRFKSKSKCRKIEPLPIAIADFTDNNGKVSKVGRLISNVISNNLVNSGQFKALETASFYCTSNKSICKTHFSDWTPLGIKALVTGSVNELDESNQIEVEFRLWDIVAETDMIGLRLTVDKNSWRRVAHIISDETFERLTGDKGYFDTRIVYISESDQQIIGKKIGNNGSRWRKPSISYRW